MARKSLEEIYGVSTTQQSATYTPPMQVQNQPKRRSLEEIYGTQQPAVATPTIARPPTITKVPFPDAGISSTNDTFMSNLGASAKETLIDPFTSRFGNIDYGNQNIASNALQTVGALAGGAVDVVGKGLLGAAKLVTPQPVEQAVGDTLGAIGSGVSNAIPDTVKQSLSDWASQHPEAAANLGSIVDITSLVPLGKSATAIKRAITPVNEAKNIAAAETAAQRIVQPSKPELFRSDQAVNAFKDLPEGKITTYSQITETLNKNNAIDLAKVTETLKKDKTKYGIENFEINREGIKFNPVKDAISSLKELGTKTADTALLAKIKPYELLLARREMTQNDVNELAKLLGSKKNAFTQSGTLLKNTNAIKAENTRGALKEIARTDMPPEVAALDRAVSERINTTERMNNIANAVGREVQRAENLNLFQKGVKVAEKVGDLFTGRLVSSIIRELRSNGRLSATEIEAELAKNLKIIQEINKTKDIRRMDEFLKGIGYFTGSQVVNQTNQPATPK